LFKTVLDETSCFFASFDKDCLDLRASDKTESDFFSEKFLLRAKVCPPFSVKRDFGLFAQGRHNPKTSLFCVF